MNLGSRLRHHINNYKHHRYDNPLYRAFDKYGINNFSVEILFFINNPEPCVKNLLDLLEISYIETYNAYGKTGYNQTRGGDGGVLGYKFTQEQREKVSKCSRIAAEKHSIEVVLCDIHTNTIRTFKSISNAAKELHTTHSQISRLCNWKQYMLDKRWVGSLSLDTIKQRKDDVIEMLSKQVHRKPRRFAPGKPKVISQEQR